MLLNRVVAVFLLTLILTGCHSVAQNSRGSAHRISVNINSEIDERVLSKLEQLMIDNLPDGFNEVSIFTSPGSYNSALSLQQYFFKNYQIKPHIYRANNISKLRVQLENHVNAPCYLYQLEDFNWYKSTPRGLALYNRSEVCATNLNDKAIRDRK